MRPSYFAIFLAGCLLWVGGCASEEFVIVSPPEFRQVIPQDDDLIVNSGPLEYRFIIVEDHLVIRVKNSTADILHLLGDQSTILDPSGQVHPVAATTLPPGAQLKIVLPPVAHLEPTGPHVSVGAGAGFYRGGYGPGWSDGLGRSDVMPEQSRYVAVYDAGEEPWPWSHGGEVRLILTFQGARETDKPISQVWVFAKQKHP
jgi:hypothetical protein